MSQYPSQPYSARFLAATTPINLQFTAHAMGYDIGTDLSKSFTYVDIGCGKALTLIMLASIYPESQFIGIDINQTHIDYNQALAKANDINNVRFIKQSIDETKAKDLPNCDFMVAHGVLSWVQTKTRQALFQLMNSCLSESGIGYLHYNALPGLAPILPLHQLIQSLFTPEQSKEALAFVGELFKNKAGYFTANPQAQTAVEQFLQNTMLGDTHFQHEFFSQAWQPLYAQQVAELATAQNLHFLGQSSLWDNMDRTYEKLICTLGLRSSLTR